MNFKLLCLSFLIILNSENTFQASLKIEDDPNVPFIEAYIESLKEEDFLEDAIVIRHPSPDVVKFKNPLNFRNGTTIFNQKAFITEGKKVIVLSGYDDYIRRSDSTLTAQRVFITLTRKSDGEDEYYVNYAYVRDLFPGEKEDGAIQIGTQFRRIEVDVWDRRGADNNLETRLGWSVCSRSVFISCLGDPTRLHSYEKGDEPDYPDELTEGGGELPPPKFNDPNEPTSVQYYHGFFTDLVDEFTHSWFVGASIMFITNAKLRINSQVVPKEAGDLDDGSGQTIRSKRQSEVGEEEVVTETIASSDIDGTDDVFMGEGSYTEEGGQTIELNLGSEDTPSDGDGGEEVVVIGTDGIGQEGVAIGTDGIEQEGVAIGTDGIGQEGVALETDGIGQDGVAIGTDDGKGEKDINIQIGGGGIAGNGENQLQASIGSNTIGNTNVKVKLSGNGWSQSGSKRGNQGNTIKGQGVNIKLKGQRQRYQPSRAELQRCFRELSNRNAGVRGHGIVGKTIFGFGRVANRIQEGAGGRGSYGDLSSPAAGMHKPLDTIEQFLASFTGFKPGQNSNRSPGTAIMNGVKSESDLVYGLSNGVALNLGVKMSNNRSHLDSLTDEIWKGVSSVPAMGVNMLDSIAKPLGLTPLPHTFAGTVGAVMSGIASIIISPIKLALEFGKVGLKALGLGGMFAMKGSSDNRGVKYCLNHLATIKQLRDVELGKQYAQSGRSFGSKAVNMEHINEKSDKANVDLFTPIGWRGLYLHESEPFIGLGSCIVDDNITLTCLTSLNTSLEAANFYLTTLRTNCNKLQKVQFLDLIERREIIFNADEKTFLVNPEHIALSKKKLLPSTAARFSQAFEIQEYTKAYVAEFKYPTIDLQNPDNLLIHHAVNTLRKMVLNSFSVAITQFPNHTLKLMRNIMITLKSAFVRLLQSWQVVNICQRCLPQEQWVLGDDLISVISVMDFITYKFEPSIPEAGVSAAELTASYEAFYLERRIQFAERLAAYVLPPYGKVGIPDYGSTEVTFIEATPGSDDQVIKLNKTDRRKRKSN